MLDTGLGEIQESWEFIINELSVKARVCAYDRAGYGLSEPGPMRRDAQQVADELQLLLTNAGEDGPFIMVGQFSRWLEYASVRAQLSGKSNRYGPARSFSTRLVDGKMGSQSYGSFSIKKL